MFLFAGNGNIFVLSLQTFCTNNVDNLANMVAVIYERLRAKQARSKTNNMKTVRRLCPHLFMDLMQFLSFVADNVEIIFHI
jgi:regulator of sigma D